VHAQQQLTGYRAPDGFTDVPTTFGCFGGAGYRCFTTVLSPEDAAKHLASSLGFASAATTCKVTSRTFKICEIRAMLGPTRVLAIISDRRLFSADTSPTAATDAVASTVELALVTSWPESGSGTATTATSPFELPDLGRFEGA
jgi:hypothetical protein